jgi:hypothetical protein
MVKDSAWGLELLIIADSSAALCYIIFVNLRKNQMSQFFSTCNHKWVFLFEIHFSPTNFEVQKYWRLPITGMWQHVPAFRKKLLLHSSGKNSKPRVEKHWEIVTERTFRRFWGTCYTSLHGRQVSTPLPWIIRYQLSPKIWSMWLALLTWILKPWRWLFTAETCSGNIRNKNVFIQPRSVGTRLSVVYVHLKLEAANSPKRR